MYIFNFSQKYHADPMKIKPVKALQSFCILVLCALFEK